MKDVWGFSFLGWIPDGHAAGIPDTEHEGPRGSVSPHDGNSMSRVASQHKREHLFGIPCVPICQTSWISCLQTTERSFRKQKQVLGTVFSILYQPSVTLREVLIKERSQRKLPRCDSGASMALPPDGTAGLCLLERWALLTCISPSEDTPRGYIKDRWDSFP